MDKTELVYIGIDVAKATLMVDFPERQIELDNSSGGLEKLRKRLEDIKGAFIVCEATGGYERALVQNLQQAGILVAVVNPAQVRAFAKSKGRLAKNDYIDASTLTEFGKNNKPKPTLEVSGVQTKLSALAQWLRQLVDGQAVIKTQAEHHDDADVIKQRKALLSNYESQIKKTEAKIKKLMEADQELRERVECLDDIAGVGFRTAALVLANMPELGRMNRGQVSALAGLAPWDRDSGEMKGKRCIGGGRSDVRLILYMPALCASRCNPVLSPLYDRLINKGKAHKVALMAVMRRLLIHMNCSLKKLAERKATTVNAQISEEICCKI